MYVRTPKHIPKLDLKKRRKEIKCTYIGIFKF